MTLRFMLVLLALPFAWLHYVTSMPIVGRDEALADADRIGKRWAEFVKHGREHEPTGPGPIEFDPPLTDAVAASRMENGMTARGSTRPESDGLDALARGWRENGLLPEPSE